MSAWREGGWGGLHDVALRSPSGVGGAVAGESRGRPPFLRPAPGYRMEPLRGGECGFRSANFGMGNAEGGVRKWTE